MRRAVLLCAAAAACDAALVEKTMAVGGYVCTVLPTNQTAWVVRPDDDARYPLISFAHGLGSGGDAGVKEWYSNIIRHIASSGYVVVALESALGLCLNEYKDQIRNLEWALQDDELKAHIDTTNGTGIAGQSMGGGSTVMASTQADAVKKYNIKVAVAIHPMPIDGIDPKCDIMFLTGSADDTVSPESVWGQYGNTSGVEKVFAEIKGGEHIDSTDKGAGLENPYIYDWLDCKLKGDGAACARVTTCAEPGLAYADHGCHHDAGTR